VATAKQHNTHEPSGEKHTRVTPLRWQWTVVMASGEASAMVISSGRICVYVVNEQRQKKAKSAKSEGKAMKNASTKPKGDSRQRQRQKRDASRNDIDNTQALPTWLPSTLYKMTRIKVHKVQPEPPPSDVECQKSHEQRPL
jgi:formylmethanofuran dehydrogenase subunit E